MIFAPLTVATLPVTTPLPSNAWPAASVKEGADTSKIAPLLTEMFWLFSEPLLPSFNLPLLTVVVLV